MSVLDGFRQVWLVDFEYRAPDGERPDPICLVAREYRTGHVMRLWCDEFGDNPPYDIGADSLFVAYYASAELGCHLALRWGMPARILDLCAEFKCLTSGVEVPCGRSLLGALAYHGLGGIQAIEKDTMHALAQRGAPFTNDERAALLAYCETDVNALSKLLPAMLPSLDLPRALLRGRYMAAAANIEWVGTPIDVATWGPLQEHWSDIQERLIDDVDRAYDVFDGTTFKVVKFADYLTSHNIPWPRLPTGTLALDKDTFSQMANTYPELRLLRELRKTLAELKLNKLAVGSDGRNRCLLSAFGAKTGRNTPSSTRFVFGLPAWCRAIIKPERNRALAYVDYSQQEIGVAAALSGDANLKRAYESGDVYLATAKQTGVAPPDATRKTHSDIRNQFKIVSLATQYGAGPKGLALSLGKSEAYARELLQRHKATYRTFWCWVQGAVDHAMLTGSLHTVFGWQVHVTAKANPRSLMNFPMQGNGAEITRLACCLLTEQGIRVCAPVHDAVLVESDVDEIEATVAETQRIMADASAVVLDGFRLRTDAKIVRWPDRYMDARGVKMWQTVSGILAEVATQPVAPRDTHVSRRATGTCRAARHPYSLLSYR